MTLDLNCVNHIQSSEVKFTRPVREELSGLFSSQVVIEKQVNPFIWFWLSVLPKHVNLKLVFVVETQMVLADRGYAFKGLTVEFFALTEGLGLLGGSVHDFAGQGDLNTVKVGRNLKRQHYLLVCLRFDVVKV